MQAVKHLYHEIDAEDMQIANDDTRYAEVGSYYAGVKQRWLLVLHEPSRQRQDATLQKRIDKEYQTAQKALQRLANKDYECEDAVCKAVDALKKKWHYHDATLTIRTETRYRQSGRPTEHSPSDTVWCFDAELVEDDARIETIRRTHGKYVIATNDLEDTCLSAQQMLATYKSQSSSVERGFRFLKAPLFFADRGKGSKAATYSSFAGAVGELI